MHIPGARDSSPKSSRNTTCESVPYPKMGPELADNTAGAVGVLLTVTVTVSVPVLY